jgi:hypothetical protein
MEMEAVGVVNDVSDLVISGICEYADPHKNNNWQGCSTSHSGLEEIAMIVIPSPIPYHHERNMVQNGQTNTKESQVLIVRDWLR